jgi:hypothetical protein
MPKETKEPKRVSKLLRRLFLLLFGLLLGVLAGELLTRQVGLQTFAGATHPMDLGPDPLRVLALDEELGFMPRVGENEYYGLYGCLPNQYDVNDRGGRRRLLFIGDSVTHRGKIVDALREIYGDEHYEYWNAGVESFNTVQELALYRRYNHRIRPDHVILTFHNNDFLQTPVAYRHEGQLHLGVPLTGSSSRWLLKNSALYRTYVLLTTSRTLVETEDVEQSLTELKRAVEEDGAKLSVVLLPIIAPSEKWKGLERESRDYSLQILTALELPVFDLLGTLDKALSDGVEVDEIPGDIWHPSQELADRFAEYLAAEGLLESHSKDG